MLSYILLFALVAIVSLGVIRASKHNQPGGIHRSHQQREPYIKAAQDAFIDEMETVGKPRIVSRASKPVAVQEEIEEEIQDQVVILKQPRVAQCAPQTTVITEAAPLLAKPVPPPAEENEVLGDVVVLHVIAPAEMPYRGYELLQALLSAGLRYGKWHIFHRHEEISGRGPVLFSLASSLEPGTFDLAKMGSFSTPGLILFMRISAVEKPALTFEKLLTAARQLTAELGGTVCDEKRFTFSTEKLANWRAQL